jgi:Putative Actinobacterial Holin-X, holin superfamily III
MKTIFTESSPKPETDAVAVRRLLAEAVESLGELVADHVRLARVELATDVRIYATATGSVVAAVLLLAVGYVLAAVAAAVALARSVGTPAAFGLVAAFHLLVGVVCVGAASSRVRRTMVLRETAAEARRSVRALARPSERSVS